jgi:hypothetical protein
MSQISWVTFTTVLKNEKSKAKTKGKDFREEVDQ